MLVQITEILDFGVPLFTVGLGSPNLHDISVSGSLVLGRERVKGCLFDIHVASDGYTGKALIGKKWWKASVVVFA